MKVYIISAWYPSNKSDLNGMFVRQQAHALANCGHDIAVIHIEPVTFTRLFRQPKHDVHIWQDGTIRTISHKVIIPIPGKLADVQDKYISKLFYKIIKGQIEADKANGLGTPDILHAHVSHSCAYYCLYAKEKLNIPLVVTEHYSGLLLGTATKREYGRVRETINGADAFIFVGSNFQKSLCSRLDIHKRTYIVPNMVDTNGFEIKQRQNETFTYLSAGSLKANKSFHLVVKAFHEAFAPYEPVKLIIAGDGEERQNIENLIFELKENTRITMFGRYTREQSRRLFSEADAFVLTSKVETFGIVYIEALASGLPCIGTKGQGAEDIIDETNGFLVEYGNVEELAQRMRDLYDKYDGYEVQIIRQKCTEKFSVDSVCKQIEQIYKAVNQV